LKADFELAPPLQQIDRTYVLSRGRKLSYFGGCDYFRLSSHPRILASIREGMQRYGLSVSASRITTGNHPLYEELEKRVARYFGFAKAVFVPSGYIANLVLAEALAGEFDTVFIDEKAHPSLQTAVRQLGCRVTQFSHLGLKLKMPGRAFSRAVIATEGMFGQNGAIAPVHDYLKTGARLWIDDAHGAGVREVGRDSVEPRIIKTITFSKAFGVYGGAILCSTALAKRIVSTRIFAGQTPLPLPLAHACLEAMDLLRKGSPLRKRLEENVAYIGASTPIIQIATGSASLKKTLLRNNIFPTWIRYPGGPMGGSFRFAISSEHTREQLDLLAGVLTSESAYR
jgi:7-keto-8-aminopelargonate synthetase-like enzyme